VVQAEKGGNKRNDNDKQKFARELSQVRSELYPEASMYRDQVLDGLERNGSPIRARTLEAKWLPIQCSVLGIKTTIQQTLYGGGAKENTVHKVVDVVTKKSYAWKLFGKADDFAAEMNFFTFADHPYIIKPICVMRDPKNDLRAGMLLEFNDGLSSLEYARLPSTTPHDLVRIAAQLLSALEYTHWLGFVHADLKADNVLVDRRGNVKMIDFGFALPLPHFKSNRGNPNILAPELAFLVPGPINEAIDWWAFGATIATWNGFKYLPAYRKPGHEKRRLHMDAIDDDGDKYVAVRIGKTVGWKFGEAPFAFPADLRQLLWVLMAPNPEDREFNTAMNLALLKGLPYFQDVHW
jgi:serine/threonine protein kinase